MDLGRSQTQTGSSPELSPVFSANPRALTMIRVGSERSFRMPWILGYLGPTEVRFGVAAMGQNRDRRGSVLITMEGRIRPIPALELGLSLLNQQGGDGAPTATFWERVIDTFGFFAYRRPFRLTNDTQISNKLLGLDARLRLPDVPLEFYVEFTTEDDHDVFSDLTQGAWMNATWLWGGRAMGIGPEGRFDFRLEAFQNGPVVAGHYQFTSGLTLDGRTLGSPLGPEASGATATLEQPRRVCARPAFALERLYAPGGIVSLASPESRLVYRLPSKGGVPNL